jgi:MarR-like DNA-binding transcriptional regulator SgrR of sgrS sRNA
LGLIHETLLRIAPDGSVAPSLAASWVRTDGAWILALQPGLTFHDGKSVTSKEAVRSLRRFLRSSSAAAAALAASLEGGAAFRSGSTEDLPGLDDPEARLVSLRPVPGGTIPLAALASLGAAVTSDTGAGAGPFMPTVSIPGRLAATAFAGHVRGRPFLDRVMLSRSERTPAAELRSRTVDLAEGEEGVSARATLLLLLDPGVFRSTGARSAVRRLVDGSDLARLIPGSIPSPSLLCPELLPPLPDGPLPDPAPVSGRVPLSVASDVPPLASQRIVALLGSLGLQCQVTVLSPEGVREARHGARLLLFSPEVAEASLALAEVASLAGQETPVTAVPEEEDPDQRRSRLLAQEAELRGTLLAIPLVAAPVSFGTAAPLHGGRLDPAGRLSLEDAWLEP